MTVYDTEELRDAADDLEGHFHYQSGGAEVAAAKMRCAANEIERLRSALEHVADPIKWLEDEATRTGAKLDGHAAVSLMNDARYLRSVAKDTLKQKETE